MKSVDSPTESTGGSVSNEVTPANRVVVVVFGTAMAVLYLFVGRQSADEVLPRLDITPGELGDIVVLGVTVLAQFGVWASARVWQWFSKRESSWAVAQSELISLASGVFGSIVTVFVLFELLAFESEPTEFVRTVLVAISPFVIFLGVVWLLCTARRSWRPRSLSGSSSSLSWPRRC